MFYTNWSLKSKILTVLLTLKHLLMHLHLIHGAIYSCVWCLGNTKPFDNSLDKPITEGEKKKELFFRINIK